MPRRAVLTQRYFLILIPIALIMGFGGVPWYWFLTFLALYYCAVSIVTKDADKFDPNELMAEKLEPGELRGRFAASIEALPKEERQDFCNLLDELEAKHNEYYLSVYPIVEDTEENINDQ